MPEARTFVRPDGRRFVPGSLDGPLPPGELFAAVDEGDDQRLRTLEAPGEAFAVLHARGERNVWAEVDETTVGSRRLLEGLGGRVVGASLELRRPWAPEPSRALRRTRT